GRRSSTSRSCWQADVTDVEKGFGSGLRRQIERKQGIEVELPEQPEPEPTPELIIDLLPEPVATGEERLRVAQIQAELAAALDRERELRDALSHQVEAYERELAQDRDVALKEAELDQERARAESARQEAEEASVVLRIQRDQLDEEKGDLARQRAELVAEQARLAELGMQLDQRLNELASADTEK